MPQLSWPGPDHTSAVVATLDAGLREQDLRVLVRDGNSRHRRLRGRTTCTGERLDTGDPAVTMSFDLAGADAA